MPQTGAHEGTNREGQTAQYVVFTLGGNEFSVAIEQVQEILVLGKLTVVPRVPRFIEGIVNVRGKIVPVINLCKQFGITGRAWGAETRIVVAEVDEQTVGMIVDLVSEVVRIPLAAIEAPPPMISIVATAYLRGIAKLGNRILVLLNLEKVLSPDELVEAEKAVA